MASETETAEEGDRRRAAEGEPVVPVRRCRHGHVLVYPHNNICGTCRQNAGRQSHKNRKGFKDGAGI